MNLLQFFYKLKYQIMYYILGSKALIDDWLHRRSNRVDLYQKSGEVAVITGGARGIGVEIVKKLLLCDMHVIIGCRNPEKGEQAVQKIRSFGVLTGTTSIYPLNLKSLTSVKQFAESVLENHAQIHILINNAGIMFVPFEETESGFESHFMVNYLGHFLLTQLLLPNLESGSPRINRRIVNVTSCAYNLSPPLDFSDINMKEQYIPHAAYARSKLAQVMSTISLEAKMRERNSPVQVMAVHPGIVDTDLFDGTLLKVATPWILSKLSKTPEQGATGIVYAAIASSSEGGGGKYYSNCTIQPFDPIACDVQAQDKLYQFSMDSIKSFLPQLRKPSTRQA
ncbi:polyprenol dehydrogenase [Bemisia tabaci]|uniref:polyprenol dehydrogenase n=2 Tax=Bemisia tabaci TaxID=7038 RepID=UPI003B281CBA